MYVLQSDHSGRYVVRIDEHDGKFVLGYLDDAEKFITVAEVLQFVSRWHAFDNCTSCGRYSIVRVEKGAWVARGAIL